MSRPSRCSHIRFFHVHLGVVGIVAAAVALAGCSQTVAPPSARTTADPRASSLRDDRPITYHDLFAPAVRLSTNRP